MLGSGVYINKHLWRAGVGKWGVVGDVIIVVVVVIVSVVDADDASCAAYSTYSSSSSSKIMTLHVYIYIKNFIQSEFRALRYASV